MAAFVGRTNELETLKREYQREDAAFVVVYGRRRIGKTATVLRFLEGKRAIYYLATEQLDSLSIDSFKGVVATELGDAQLASARADRWEDAFDAIAGASDPEERLVVVIDEFQYLGKVNPEFPSILQRLWDARLRHANIMLVLIGSLARIIQQQTLSSGSPLYGCLTAQLHMEQIPFADCQELFRTPNDWQLVERYSITGGIPKYIEQLPAHRDIYRSIEESVLDPSGFFYSEPGFLLSREVVEVGTYFSIIRAIAAGNQRPGNIANVLGMSQTSLSRYFSVLIDQGIIHREVPTTEDNPAKSKRGRYFIADNLTRFWFRFVLPYMSAIESGHAEAASRAVRAGFVDEHVALVYADVCREALWNLAAEGVVPFKLERVGRWWDDKHAEIDVLGIGEEDALVGECRFSKEPVGADALHDLEAAAAFVDLGGRRPFYALFSIDGFTRELKRLASARDDLLLLEGARW